MTLSFTIFFGQKNLNRAHMLFQVLCGFEPVFYTTHPNEEPFFHTVFFGVFSHCLFHTSFLTWSVFYHTVFFHVIFLSTVIPYTVFCNSCVFSVIHVKMINMCVIGYAMDGIFRSGSSEVFLWEPHYSKNK